MNRPKKDAYILAHLPQVRNVAIGIRLRIPQGFELQELIGCGTLGLVASAETFDPKRGAARSWARRHIASAIWDYVLDRHPSGSRRREGEERHVCAGQNYRRFNPNQTAFSIDILADAMDRNSLNPRKARVRNILQRLAVWPADASEDEERAEREERSDALASTVLYIAREVLTRRELEVLRLYYQEERSLRQIGRSKVLDIGWRRVAGEYDEAIRKLRNAVHAYGMEKVA
jgi:RNA polymerase sigma factor FliA